MSPWEALYSHLPALAAKVRAMRPPKMRVVVDGQVRYWALAVPEENDLKAHAAWRALSLEDWLAERLAVLAEAWPKAKEVELLGLWAGDPPRLEPLARVRARVKTKAVRA